MATPIDIVTAWQNAANQQDREALQRVSHPNIEIVGPRGAAYGHDVLSAWLERAGLSVTPKRLFARGEDVVVAQHGVWRSDGTVVGEAEIASRFRVEDERVTVYSRYDDLTLALADAGLTPADEQALP